LTHSKLSKQGVTYFNVSMAYCCMAFCLAWSV